MGKNSYNPEIHHRQSIRLKGHNYAGGGLYFVTLCAHRELIAEYIRMNPWRCVQDFGGGLRGMGNPALWNGEKLGVLCSRNAPRPKSIPRATLYLGGFHSPMEKEIFAKLLELKKPLIWCPAWGLEHAAVAPGTRAALEENRMLVLEMKNCAGDLASAEARNRFVLENADHLWLPHVTLGGMIDRLLQERPPHF